MSCSTVHLQHFPASPVDQLRCSDFWCALPGKVHCCIYRRCADAEFHAYGPCTGPRVATVKKCRILYYYYYYSRDQSSRGSILLYAQLCVGHIRVYYYYIMFIARYDDVHNCSAILRSGTADRMLLLILYCFIWDGANFLKSSRLQSETCDGRICRGFTTIINELWFLVSKF